ncbi:hypothetical protein BC829DRAFT_444079 [Chytridium lagenaria]|nr:hypothetical protein BC829DRAFT_444079 [Chytridium lagenaria]
MFNPNHETPTHRRQFTNEVPANLNQGAPVVSFYANAQLLTPANSIGSPALYSAPPAGDLQSLQSITPTSLPFMYTSAGSYMSSVPATRRALSEYLFNPPGCHPTRLRTYQQHRQHTYIQGNIPYGGVHFNVNPSMPTSHVRPPSYQPHMFVLHRTNLHHSNPHHPQSPTQTRDFFPHQTPLNNFPLTLQSMPTARAIVPSSQPYPQMQEVRPILDASAVTGDDEETSGSRQARSVFTKEQRDILEDLMRKKRLTNGTEHRTLRHQLSKEYGRRVIKRYLEKMQRAEEVSQQLPLSSRQVNVETALMPPLVTSQAGCDSSGPISEKVLLQHPVPVAATRENMRQDVNVGHQQGEDDTENNNTLPAKFAVQSYKRVRNFVNKRLQHHPDPTTPSDRPIPKATDAVGAFHLLERETLKNLDKHRLICPTCHQSGCHWSNKGNTGATSAAGPVAYLFGATAPSHLPVVIPYASSPFCSNKPTRTFWISAINSRTLIPALQLHLVKNKLFSVNPDQPKQALHSAQQSPPSTLPSRTQRVSTPEPSSPTLLSQLSPPAPPPYLNANTQLLPHYPSPRDVYQQADIQVASPTHRLVSRPCHTASADHSVLASMSAQMSELLQEVRLLREANERLQATLAIKDLEIRRLTSKAEAPKPILTASTTPTPPPTTNKATNMRLRRMEGRESSEDKQMAVLQANITKSVVSEVMAALDAKDSFASSSHPNDYPPHTCWDMSFAAATRQIARGNATPEHAARIVFRSTFPRSSITGPLRYVLSVTPLLTIGIETGVLEISFVGQSVVHLFCDDSKVEDIRTRLAAKGVFLPDFNP